jgi:hypothetical protein
MNPEFERIRGYLQEQASSKTIEELITRVEEGVTELEQAGRSVPESALKTIPPGEEWSPWQCISHIIETNLSVGRQVLHVAHTGELPPPEEPAVPDSVDAAFRHHREAMDSLYAHVRDAQPDAFLEVTWPHMMFGQLNWREWFIFLRIHCRDHARQLNTMLEAVR